MNSAAAPLATDTNPPIHDAQLIQRLEAERYQAVLNGDHQTLARMCDPHLAYTHSTGVIDTAETYIGKFRNGHYKYESVDHPIRRIDFIGPIALVFGEMHADLVAGGQHKQLNNLALSVWNWTDHGWRLRAYQPTPLPRA